METQTKNEDTEREEEEEDGDGEGCDIESTSFCVKAVKHETIESD